LSNGRGIFCKFRDPASIANRVSLLLDEEYRKKMQKRAYKYGKRFLWTNVARKYTNLFNSVIKGC
jgi:glycosyltransferase involved in cell wall biosynthesis